MDKRVQIRCLLVACLQWRRARPDPVALPEVLVKLVALSALALTALVPPSPSATDISFGVEQDATVRRRLSGDALMQLTDIWVTVNGEDMPPEMLGEDVEGESRMTFVLVASDHYASIEDGEALEILRTYESLDEEEEENTGIFDDSDEESDEEEEPRPIAAVIERTMRFTREAGGDEWLCEPADGGEEIEAAIEELADDLDYLVLLPSEEVSPGDEWTVTMSDLGAFLEPGVDLRAEIEGDEDIDGLPPEIAAQLRELFAEAEVTCTYSGDEDVDGSSCARIDLAGEVSAEFDLSEVAAGMFEEDGEETDEPAPELVSCTVEAELDIEGALLSNLDAGRFERFEFEAQAVGEGRIEAVLAIPDLDLEMEMLMGGKMSIQFLRSDSVE